MFTDGGEDRTIAPTPRRLADARRQGLFTHSRDLTSAAAGCAAAIALWFVGPQLWDSAVSLLATTWSAPVTSLDDAWALRSSQESLDGVAGSVAVLLGAPLLVATVVNLLQQGFRLHVRRPRGMGRIGNPFAVRRALGHRASPSTFGQTAIKCAAMCVITGWGAVRVLSATAGEPDGGVAAISGAIGRAAVECSLLLTFAFLLASVGDWFRCRRRFLRELRMTPREVREEARDAKNARRPRTNLARHVSHSMDHLADEVSDVSPGEVVVVGSASD